jgi:hypothetical protein
VRKRSAPNAGWLRTTIAQRPGLSSSRHSFWPNGVRPTPGCNPVARPSARTDRHTLNQGLSRITERDIQVPVPCFALRMGRDEDKRKAPTPAGNENGPKGAVEEIGYRSPNFSAFGACQAFGVSRPGS